MSLPNGGIGAGRSDGIVGVASTRTTFALDERLAARARQLNVNISAAARGGVVAAVKRAMGETDRVAYQRFPERPDDFWDAAEAWGAE